MQDPSFLESPSHAPSQTPPVRPPVPSTAALLHRWFIEYNPLPLASAALVLGGMWLLSRAAAEAASLEGQLGVAAVAELYAFALIAGAAFLRRSGLSRAAAMLALLAVLYQGDLTMHLETCAYLGTLGTVAAVLWWMLFALKLHLIGVALRLRLGVSARVLPLLAAAALALFPLVRRELSPETGGVLATLLVFAVGAAGLFSRLKVVSAAPMDIRGVRAVRATWITWAALFVLHVAYGVMEHELAAALVPALLVLATRWIRQPGRVMAALVVVPGLVAWVAPEQLALTAFMAGVMSLLHTKRSAAARVVEAGLPDPYRAVVGGITTTSAPAPRWHRIGYVSLACLAFYVCARTAGAMALGDLPPRWPLDAPLVLACAALAWRLRHVLPLSTIGFALGWRFWEADVLSRPQGALAWGLWLTGTGFGLLLVSVLASRFVSCSAASDVEVLPSSLEENRA